MVGVTLLIGESSTASSISICRAQTPISALLPLVAFALILPNFTQTTAGPTYSTIQQVAMVVVSLSLYILFLFLQTGRYHAYFEQDSESSARARDERDPVWRPILMMAAYMAAIVYLVEQFGPPVDYLLETLEAPAPLGGIFIALLVATPESDRRGEGGARQPDAAGGQHFARLSAVEIGSSVLIINHLLGKPIVLGVEHTDFALLILTLAVSMVTFTSGRTNVLQGVVHLLLFSAYVLLIFQG